jgi:hypothetical protein
MSRTTKRTLALVVLAIIGVVTAVLLWSASRPSAEARALERMTPADRAVLYERTYAATRTLCEEARTNAGLRDRCAASAEFVLAFPECDDACHAVATPSTPRGATR